MRATLLLLLLSATAAQAQRVPCRYDECALRVEGRHILAGAAGTRAATFNLIGSTDLSALVSGDSATFYAHQFERRQSTGGALSLVGGLIGVAGLVWAYSDDNGGWDTSEGGFWMMVGGAGVGLVGSISINKAKKDLARAIWWNNRELLR